MVLRVIQLVKEILKKINELNEIKKLETKSKRLIEKQRKLLSLFHDLKTIFNVNENENENVSGNENENESVNESENENESVNENENKNDDGQYYLKQINNNFKKIDETKSFEDQINILKKISDSGDYCVWSIMKVIKKQILDHLN